MMQGERAVKTEHVFFLVARRRLRRCARVAVVPQEALGVPAGGKVL